MTNEEYIISQISERSLADMFNTGNFYYNNLNDRIYKAFQYWKGNTNAFNKICGTNFTMEQMSYIYTYLGNGIKHDLTKQFVRNGFDLFVIEKYAQKGNKEVY